MRLIGCDHDAAVGQGDGGNDHVEGAPRPSGIRTLGHEPGPNETGSEYC